jgi:exodeoxyribonuclease III
LNSHHPPPPLKLAYLSYCILAFKIASWNVAGLRAVLAKSPNVFKDFVSRHDVDILCLQETKLQEIHFDDPKLNIKQTMGLTSEFDDYWSCSTAKKGYSGTAVFIRRRKNVAATSAATASDTTKKQGTKKQTSMLHFVKPKAASVDDATEITMGRDDIAIDAGLLLPSNVEFVLGKEKHDMEGRLICVEYPCFTLCNVYVPNAGQKLERLSYRVNEWDKDFLQYIHQKRENRNGLPVIWLGDLNVAHTNLEVWNDGAKHLAKQAGVTPEERASFQQQLDSGHIDAFRHLHPTAAGHYSYWSMRAGNRAVNKGLRLDYFICDTTMFDEKSQVTVRDSYMDATQEGSDHCPVILELEIKGKLL